MGHTICWKETCICLERPVRLFSEKFGSDIELGVWAKNIQASTQKSGSWQFKLIRALPGWIVLMHPENILVSSVCSLAMSLILFWRVLAWFSSCDCRDAPFYEPTLRQPVIPQQINLSGYFESVFQHIWHNQLCNSKCLLHCTIMEKIMCWKVSKQTLY